MSEIYSVAENVSVDAMDVFGPFDVESLGSDAAADSTPVVAAQVTDPPVEKHPWPLTVYYLDRGVKKLRRVKAEADAEAFAKQTTLWRGLQNVSVDIENFLKLGGTELAPMSTTTDEDVARKYAKSNVPLVLKYEVVGMRAGVSIQWLSLYPKESEYLYPPLTYLSYKRHYEDDGQLVVVVEPVMP